MTVVEMREPYEDTQELYETIRAFYMREGAALARSVSGSICYYRTEEGHACAAGCTFPDAYYRSGMENTVISHLVPHEKSLQELYRNVDMTFLRAAQGAHDSMSTETVEEFVVKLDELAATWQLKVVPARDHHVT